MKSLTILPVYNEVDAIGPLLDRFTPESGDVIAVDDGSTDGSTEAIQQRKVITIRHIEREGIGKCLQDGIAYALDHAYDVVIVMAGNGKDNPAEIPKLIAAINQGFDYVQGSRFLEGGESKNLPGKRWLAIKLFTWLWSLCTAHHLSDVTNGFRAYRTSLLRNPEVRWQQDWLKTYEFEFYIHYKALTLKNIRFLEIPVTKNYPKRKNYSKIRPGLDWIRIIRPLFLLMTGVKD